MPVSPRLRGSGTLGDGDAEDALWPSRWEGLGQVPSVPASSSEATNASSGKQAVVQFGPSSLSI